MDDSTDAPAPGPEPAPVPEPGPPPPAIDPNGVYVVQLSRKVRLAPGVWATPRDHDVRMAGAKLLELGDAVLSYAPVE